MTLSAGGNSRLSDASPLPLPSPHNGKQGRRSYDQIALVPPFLFLAQHLENLRPQAVAPLCDLVSLSTLELVPATSDLQTA